jgi:hypothetical protein
VRHHWDEDGSPLRSDEAGSEFKDVVEGQPDLLVTKTVHSGARVGSDLGYEVGFAIDATHTFDQGDQEGAPSRPTSSLESRHRTSIRSSAGC